jgi:translation initiation factor IF-2
MKEIKEELTDVERADMIAQLVEDYEAYINDSDDEELQEIFNSGCFTVGSMNYYNEKGLTGKRE